MIDCGSTENPVSEKVVDALRKAAQRLRDAGVADPVRDARLLMRWAADLSGAALAAAPDQPLSADEAARFEAAVLARAARRPVSQIVGGREFYGRWFQVTDAVLDPRPESEILVAEALAAAPTGGTPLRVLDLGVGSGALLLSVLAERADATGLGIDASAPALAVASANAAALGLAERVELRKGDWLRGVAERFDIVLCNPPYIDAAEIAELSPEVRLYEPHVALSPGPDGLSVYRRLASEIGFVLTEHGSAHFEVGLGQADAVSNLFDAAGFRTTRHADLDGRRRVVSVTRSALAAGFNGIDTDSLQDQGAPKNTVVGVKAPNN